MIKPSGTRSSADSFHCWGGTSFGLVEDIESEAAAELKKKGLQPLGVQAVLKQHPHTRPNRPKKSPAPLFHAATKAVRKAFWQTYAAFVAACRPQRPGLGGVLTAISVATPWSYVEESGKYVARLVLNVAELAGYVEMFAGYVAEAWMYVARTAMYVAMSGVSGPVTAVHVATLAVFVAKTRVSGSLTVVFERGTAVFGAGTEVFEPETLLNEPVTMVNESATSGKATYSAVSKPVT